jgi:uncharacterized protein YlxP (DUF503 family)
MHVGALRIELRIRGMRSLKEKRHVIKSIVTDIGRSHSVAIAEVGYQDLWQRSDLGIAAVSASRSHVERMLVRIGRDLDRRSDIEVLGSALSYFTEEDR